MGEKISLPTIDRIVFLIFIIIILIPFLRPINLPIPISADSEEVYKAVEDLAEGAVVLCEENTGFANINVVGPGEAAFLSHLFKKVEEKDIRIITYSTSMEGAQVSEIFLRDIVGRPHPFYNDPLYGEYWVHLGYIAGGEPITAAMVTDMLKTAPMDMYGNPTADMEIFKYVAARAPPYDLINGDDFNLFMVAHMTVPDRWPRWWGPYGDPQRGFPAGNNLHFASAMIRGQLSPYVGKGMSRGGLFGPVPCAEYEQLLGKPGLAVSFMDTQNFAHLFAIALVFVANIMYMSGVMRRRAEK